MARVNYKGPQQFKPLSPWAYFGYSILFSIPIVGLIMLIVLSFNDNNINRRNFARSYWCVYVIVAVLLLICIGSGISIATLASYGVI